jgi:hypothetical protein
MPLAGKYGSLDCFDIPKNKINSEDILNLTGLKHHTKMVVPV